VEARHRRRVHQAQHQAAKQVVAFAVQRGIGTLLVGDPKGITDRGAGRVQNLRLRQWRRTHLLQALRDKAERAGIVVRLVDERGTSSTCPGLPTAGPQAPGPSILLSALPVPGHRDLVGARNIAAKAGGGPTSTCLPVLVEHRRAGIVPVRRDRRRHLHDQRRRRSCLASGHPGGSCRCWASLVPCQNRMAGDEDQTSSALGQNLFEGALVESARRCPGPSSAASLAQ
jgi:IS605 OrfB family transposase